MPSYLMGIDLGSTSLKAIIFDLEGNIVSSGNRPTIVSYLDAEHPTWACWEPEKIWGGVCAAIKDAVAKIQNPSYIKGVAVTGFGMDGMPIDKNGNWLYPFISWHCPRTVPQSIYYSEKMGRENIFSISGKQVLSIDTIYRLMWMNENHPEILKRADKWLLIEDFINFMLCGCKATDYSMASCTSVFEQKTHKWSEYLISSAGINIDLFPNPLQSGTYLGEITEKASLETGLAAGTPVVLGGHDYICASLAVGAFKPEILFNITGTWEMVIQSSSEPYLNHEMFASGLIAESHVARNTYITMGCAVSADMLEWFRKNYGFEEKHMMEDGVKSDWDYLMEKAEISPAGSNGAFFLPHFSGSGTPANDNRSLGAFVGLSNLTGKGCMLRAMIEGLNYQFRENLDAFEKALRIKPNKIIASGGAVRNKFWMQNKANVAGREIEVSEVEETTALGAALLAGIGVGVYKDENDAYQRTFRPGKLYEPDTALASKYDGYYSIYKEIYPSLKELNWKLFDTFRL